jgi:hypothetical protein
LNGHAKVFAPCFTDFFIEAVLAESVEDFIEEVSVDLAMSKVRTTYLARQHPFYSPSDPILHLLTFFQVAAAAVESHGQRGGRYYPETTTEHKVSCHEVTSCGI